MPASPTLLSTVLLLGVPAVAILALRVFPNARLSIRLFGEYRARSRVRPANTELAAAFHAQLPDDSRAGAVDERTWQDLDLDEVFCAVDRTSSEPGRQYLYHLLRTPHYDRAPLERLERIVGRFSADDGLATRVRGSLGRLDDPRAARLAHLILGALPARPPLWWTFPLLTAGSLACMAAISVWPPAFTIWIAIAIVNVLVQLAYKSRVAQFVPALHEIPAFLGVASELGAMNVEEFSRESQALREGLQRLARLRAATRWLMFEPGQAPEIVAMVYEYINLLFLFDVNAFVFATEALRASRLELCGMFEALGYIDAAQSISAWRGELREWTTPTFTEARKALRVESMVHPLLADAVPNSVELDEESVLITGSNMSGKTTFVRALGVNALLAQTFNTACARTWRAPMLVVRTSIGRSDSLVEGKSYYLAEAESVRALLEAKRGGQQHLFLLDEIFRGTNTTERVAASAAVLAYLNRGQDFVVVATHDTELLGLVGDAYVARHFREELASGEVRFDYRIHDGPSSTRNAIALLAVMGYPRDLVADAIAALDWEQRRPTT